MRPATSTPGSGQSTARSVVDGGWKSVGVPTEHGGWSLTAEPAILGLLVAWSVPGLAIGLGAMLAFVTRTPLKLVLVDLWRRRVLPRTRRAAVVAGCELIVMAVLVAVIATSAETGFWVPLAVAAPLILVELWYDMRSRSRRLVPELAGAVGIGSVATAIVLAAGVDGRVGDRAAWGLWAVIALRSLAAIPFVRAQVLLARGRAADLRLSDGTQLAVVLAAVAAFVADLVPLAALLALVAVAVWHLAEARRPPRRVAIIGVSQMVIGLIVIVATALAVR